MKKTSKKTSKKKDVFTLLGEFKQQTPRFNLAVPVAQMGKLEILNTEDIENEKLIRMLATWRDLHQSAFPTQFPVTYEGTKAWLKNRVVDAKDRVLFLVSNNKKEVVGHMGLYTFNPYDNSCEIDNVVRGREISPGLMTHALHVLLTWAYESLGVTTIYLRVFADNKRAIQLYLRCNFRQHSSIPLVKQQDGARISWEEVTDAKKGERYFLKMVHNPA